jgi:hypothetical protein
VLVPNQLDEFEPITSPVGVLRQPLEGDARLFEMGENFSSEPEWRSYSLLLDLIVPVDREGEPKTGIPIISSEESKVPDFGDEADCLIHVWSRICVQKGTARKELKVLVDLHTF